MIYCGIASVKTRERALHQITCAILPQVDKFLVALNDYDRIPSWLIHPKIEVAVLNNKFYGDAGKFLYVGVCDGYYTTLDDDLLPSKDYIKKLIEGVDKYGGVVSFHGRRYPIPVNDFIEWDKAYRCLNEVGEDQSVNMIGSGCCAFNTKSIQLKLSDFKKPNMADLWLSKKTYEMNQPMTVLAHRQGDIKYLRPVGKTIWHSFENFNEHTEILKSYLK